MGQPCLHNFVIISGQSVARNKWRKSAQKKNKNMAKSKRNRRKARKMAVGSARHKISQTSLPQLNASYGRSTAAASSAAIE